MPKSKGRAPAILWIAGSGCASQESADGSNPQVQLLYELTKRGFVTMRVEKTGTGDSEGPPCYGPGGGLGQEVRGYQAGLRALASYDYVDPQRIFLIGHSAGATLAPLVAKGQKVRAIAVAGAMGTNFFDYMFAMRQRELELAGKSQEDVSTSLGITKRCTEWLLKDHRSPDDIEKASPECQHRVRYDSPPSYIQDWADLDLAKAWHEAPDVPVLVLYGSGDFVTNEHESRELVKKIPHATYRSLPMDHGFLAYGSQRDAWNAEQGKGTGAALLTAAVDEIERFFKKH
jgi:alpha-beta hydrolase superfamily lysophospholipase